VSENEQLAALILSEDAKPLGKLSKALPALGRGNVRPSLQCLLRWVTKGVRRASDGQLVKLQAIRFGDKWVSSLQRIAYFCAQLTPVTTDADEEEPPRRRRTKLERERHLAKVEAKLDAMGIK
jgi:hypothetical protein